MPGYGIRHNIYQRLEEQKIIIGWLCCLVFKSCLTLVNPWNIARQPRWNSPGKNTRMGCHFLLQGIFQTQGSNQVSCIGRHPLPLNHQGPGWIKLKKESIFNQVSYRAGISTHRRDKGQYTLSSCILLFLEVLPSRQLIPSVYISVIYGHQINSISFLSLYHLEVG